MKRNQQTIEEKWAIKTLLFAVAITYEYKFELFHFVFRIICCGWNVFSVEYPLSMNGTFLPFGWAVFLSVLFQDP